MTPIKNVYRIFIGLLVAFALIGAKMFSGGPPPEFTGAPGEQMCTSCHSGAAVNSGPGIAEIIVEPGVTEYTPGQIYTVTVKLTEAGFSKFGFELTALDETKQMAGNLVGTDNATNVVFGSGPNASRQYVQQTALGNTETSPGQRVWTFEWEAPANNVGPVTFYLAALSANNNGNTSGDKVYSKTLALMPASDNTIFVSGVGGDVFCDGDPIAVNYVASGTFAADNQFIVQLSDENGSFTSPTNLSAQLTGDGFVIAGLPLDAPVSSLYRVRVVSTNPSVFGSDNGTDLLIQAKPVANIIESTAVACLNSGEAIYTAEDIFGQYVWLISPNGTIIDGANTATVSVLWFSGTQGTVSLYATNDCGVSDTVSTTVEIVPGPSPAAATQDASEPGATDGSITVSVADGQPPYTFSLDGAPFQGSSVYNNLGAGTYLVAVRDANGCENAVQAVIQEPGLDVLTVGPLADTILCAGNSFFIPYNDNGLFAPDNQFFAQLSDENGSFAAPTPIGIDANATGLIEATVPGNALAGTGYRIRIVATNPPYVGGDNGTDLTIKYGAVANIIQGASQICLSDGPVTFAAEPTDGAYVWSAPGGVINFGQNTIQAIVSWSVAGSYTLTLETGNECGVAQQNFSVLVTPAPSLGANATPTSAPGASDGVITVNATGGAPPYLYALGNQSYQPGSQFSGLNAGTYTVNVIDDNGCTASLDVTVPEGVTASIGTDGVAPTTLCPNQNFSVSFTRSGNFAADNLFQVELSDNTGNFTNPLTVGSSSDGPNIACTFPAGVPAGGGYRVRVVSTNPALQGLPAPQTLDALKEPLLTIASQNQNVCLNTNGTYKAEGGAAGEVYTWTVNGGNIVTGQGTTTLVVQWTAVGPQTIKFVAANVCGSQSLNYDVTVNALPTLNAMQANTSGPGMPDGSITAAGAGGVPPYQYALNGGAWQDSGFFGGLLAGTYTVQVKDAKGCIGQTPVTINEACGGLTLVPSISNVKCYGGADGTISVTVAGGLSPYLYSLDGGPYTSANLFSNLTAGAHNVVVKDGAGCTGSSQSFVAQPLHTLRFFTVVKNSTKIVASGIGGTPGYSFSIDGTNYQTSGIFSGLSQGTYILRLKDANDCEITRTVVLN